MKIPSPLLITLLIFLFIQACQKERLPQLKFNEQKTPKLISFEDSFKEKQVIENRVANFIHLLNAKGLDIKDNKDLLQQLGPVQFREQIAKELDISFTQLQIHLELADLMQLGLSDIDAQMLHFSQWNYQNPFTGTVINPKILSTADPEQLLMDIGGWAAGQHTPIVQEYQISISKIKSWIKAAQDHSNRPIKYANLNAPLF